MSSLEPIRLLQACSTFFSVFLAIGASGCEIVEAETDIYIGFIQGPDSRGMRVVLDTGDAEVEMARRRGVRVVRRLEKCIVVVFDGLLMDRSEI